MIADQESLLTSANDIEENQRAYDVGELISFASFDIPNETNTPDQTTNTLFNDDIFDPFNLYGQSTSNNSDINGDNLWSLGHYPSATSSTFHVDPFATTHQPIRDTKSPLNMFASPLITPSQFIPTRTSVPTPAIPVNSNVLPMNKLTINTSKKKTDLVTDLLDFNDPSPPPPPPPESPKFDPYA